MSKPVCEELFDTLAQLVAKIYRTRDTGQDTPAIELSWLDANAIAMIWREFNLHRSDEKWLRRNNAKVHYYAGEITLTLRAGATYRATTLRGAIEEATR